MEEQRALAERLVAWLEAGGAELGSESDIEWAIEQALAGRQPPEIEWD
jgi:hypothetical protein